MTLGQLVQVKELPEIHESGNKDIRKGTAAKIEMSKGAQYCRITQQLFDPTHKGIQIFTIEINSINWQITLLSSGNTEDFSVSKSRSNKNTDLKIINKTLG